MRLLDHMFIFILVNGRHERYQHIISFLFHEYPCRVPFLLLLNVHDKSVNIISRVSSLYDVWHLQSRYQFVSC